MYADTLTPGEFAAAGKRRERISLIVNTMVAEQSFKCRLISPDRKLQLKSNYQSTSHNTCTSSFTYLWWRSDLRSTRQLQSTQQQAARTRIRPCCCSRWGRHHRVAGRHRETRIVPLYGRSSRHQGSCSADHRWHQTAVKVLQLIIKYGILYTLSWNILQANWSLHLLFNHSPGKSYLHIERHAWRRTLPGLRWEYPPVTGIDC